MTAAATLSPSSTLPWGVPAPRRRARLHLVRPRVDRPALVGSGTDGALRLTRRGRLAVTLTTMVVLAAAPLTVLSVGAPAEAGTEVVVRSGQTLSQVAATHLPQERADLAIVRIQRANGLSSTQLQTGQVLQIPSP